jgi:hypothetical protein
MAEKEYFDPKGREDHLVPRGFLRGFTHPDRNAKDGPLEVFDLEKRVWVDPGTPDELCKETAFYDYSIDKAPVTADDAFKELEDGLHDVRKKLRESGFVGWTEHRDFLLRFGKMLAVRSKLFRERVIAKQVEQPGLRVLETDGTKVKIEPFDLRSEPGAEGLLKNFSITKMRGEIEKGAEEWSRWAWSLRTTSIECPLVTADHPVVISGAYADAERAYSEGHFAIMIPFGWDFMIAGGPNWQDPEGPLPLSPEQVERCRRMMCAPGATLLIAPMKLPNMHWVDDELGALKHGCGPAGWRASLASFLSRSALGRARRGRS